MDSSSTISGNSPRPPTPDAEVKNKPQEEIDATNRRLRNKLGDSPLLEKKEGNKQDLDNFLEQYDRVQEKSDFANQRSSQIEFERMCGFHKNPDNFPQYAEAANRWATTPGKIDAQSDHAVLPKQHQIKMKSDNEALLHYPIRRGNDVSVPDQQERIPEELRYNVGIVFKSLMNNRSNVYTLLNAMSNLIVLNDGKHMHQDQTAVRNEIAYQYEQLDSDDKLVIANRLDSLEIRSLCEMLDIYPKNCENRKMPYEFVAQLNYQLKDLRECFELPAIDKKFARTTPFTRQKKQVQNQLNGFLANYGSKILRCGDKLDCAALGKDNFLEKCFQGLNIYDCASNIPKHFLDELGEAPFVLEDPFGRKFWLTNNEMRNQDADLHKQYAINKLTKFCKQWSGEEKLELLKNQTIAQKNAKDEELTGNLSVLREQEIKLTKEWDELDKQYTIWHNETKQFKSERSCIEVQRDILKKQSVNLNQKLTQLAENSPLLEKNPPLVDRLKNELVAAEIRAKELANQLLALEKKITQSEECSVEQKQKSKEKDEERSKVQNTLYTSAFQAICQVTNRATSMNLGTVVEEALHVNRALPFPYQDLLGAGFTQTAKQNIAYVIKAKGDGTFTVKLYNDNPITFCSYKQSEMAMNHKLSHWNTTTSLSVDAQGHTALKDFAYDYALVPYMRQPEEKTVVPNNNQEKLFGWAVRLGAPMFPEFPEVHGLDYNTWSLNTWANKIAQYGAKKKQVHDYFQAHKNLKLNHVFAGQETSTKHLFDEYEQAVVNVIIDRLGAYAEDLEKAKSWDAAALENLSTAYTDLLQIQYESVGLASKTDFANVYLSEFDPDMAKTPQRVELCFALSTRAGDLIRKIENIVNDYRAVIDDNDIADGHKLSRVEKASLQSTAAVKTLEQIVSRCNRQELLRQESGSGPFAERQKALVINLLKQEIASRKNIIDENLQGVLENSTEPLPFGPGELDKDSKKASAAVLRGLRSSQVQNLPITHKSLSEAQLVSLRIKHFASQNPFLKNELKNFDRQCAQNYKIMLGEQRWDTIISNFNDVYETDSVSREFKPLTSTITPAPKFEQELFFANSYRAKGMPSCNRTQAKHVNNLARSELTNRKDGKVMFSGLRHGVLDAYDIRKEALSSATDEEKQQLLKDIISITQTLGEADLTRLDDGVTLFDTKDGIQFIRRLANMKMAEELVKAAVVSDPVHMANVRAGKPVNLKLDSMFLVSPDMTRPMRNAGKSERRLLENQRRALREMDGAEFTMPMSFMDKNILMQASVTVNVEVRSYSFSVNKYSQAGRWIIKQLLRPFTNWRRADRMNERAMEDLLGPVNQNEIGGEAGKIVNYLLKDQKWKLALQSEWNDLPPFAEETQITITPEEQQDLDARFQQMPFSNREEHAKAILELANQTKQILRRRTHHFSRNEPFMLANRTAMLSYLLGRTPAISCKNGMYRTGLMDSSLKYMAANTAASYFPAPGIDDAFDCTRKTNFALRTGNFELQQYNTGCRGYKKEKVAGQFGPYRSAFAKKLLLGKTE